MKNLLLSTIFLLCIIVHVLGADAKKTIDVSIYEVGDSIVDCDTNFRNLFQNWTSKNLTNASDYKLLSYSCLETISDSTILDCYCRLMCSGKMIGLGSSTSSHTSSVGITDETYAVQPRTPKLDSLFLAKNPRLRKLYEDRSFVQEIDRINSEEFSLREIKPGKVGVYKSPDSLSDAEYRAFLLESAKADKAMIQLWFKQLANIGDAVYVVHFRYLDKFYSDYVVCDSKTKRVKIDGFFKGVHVKVPVD